MDDTVLVDPDQTAPDVNDADAQFVLAHEPEQT